MVIAYARVSSRDQNPDMQLRQLEQYGYDKLFSEKRTGMKVLPELEKCLDELREGDELIIYRLDRLGRTLAAIVKAANRIREKKATLVSLSDNFDTKTTAGRMMMNMIAVLAEYEHDLIIERCADGREAAKKRGVTFGRPEGSGNNVAAQACVTLYGNGLKVCEIQQLLGIKSRDTVYRYLSNAGVTTSRRKKRV